MLLIETLLGAYQLEVYYILLESTTQGLTIEQLIEQQKQRKIRTAVSLVLYLATLNIQTTLAGAILWILLVSKTNRKTSIVATAFVVFVLDIGLKSCYVFYLKKKTPPDFHKKKQKIILEILAISKDLVCSVFLVSYILTQLVILAQGFSGGHVGVSHLVVSMSILVYFVIGTYFMISHGLCYEYLVSCVVTIVHVVHALAVLLPGVRRRQRPQRRVDVRHTADDHCCRLLHGDVLRRSIDA